MLHKVKNAVQARADLILHFYDLQGLCSFRKQSDVRGPEYNSCQQNQKSFTSEYCKIGCAQHYRKWKGNLGSFAATFFLSFVLNLERNVGTSLSLHSKWHFKLFSSTTPFKIAGTKKSECKLLQASLNSKLLTYINFAIRRPPIQRALGKLQFTHWSSAG